LNILRKVCSQIHFCWHVVFKSVNDLKVDGALRCVSRPKSDDKAKLDLDDIMGVVNFVEQQTKQSLPVFVAANLEREPPLKSDVLDLCMAVNRIEVLKTKVEQLATVISASAGTTSASVIPNAATSTVPGAVNLDSSDWPQLSAPSVKMHNDAPVSKNVLPTSEEPFLLDLFQSKNDNGQWFVVNAKKQKPKMLSRKITGKGDADSKSIKAAQPSSDKKESLKWHSFVSRLDSTTTAEEVSKYLTESDISRKY